MKKYKSLSKAVEATVNSKEENAQDFCLEFVQEFGLNTPLFVHSKSMVARYIQIKSVYFSFLFAACLDHFLVCSGISTGKL